MATEDAEHKRLTQKDRRAQTRAQLIEAASRVFATRGFYSASVEDVAEEAGFSKGAVYSNFASKDDLLLALLEDHAAGLLNDLRAIVERDVSLQERVDAVGKFVEERAATEHDWWVLFMEFWCYSVRKPEAAQKLAQFYEDWRGHVTPLIEKVAGDLGLPLPIEPRRIASALLALADGFMLQRLLPRGEEHEGLYADVLAMIFFTIPAFDPRNLARETETPA